MLSKKKREKLKQDNLVKVKKLKEKIRGYERSLKFLEEQEKDIHTMESLTEVEKQSQLNIINKSKNITKKNLEEYKNKLKEIS